MALARQAPPLDTPVRESEWTAPRPDCPHPDRWHSTDSDSTELEVSALVAAFVTALQPDLVVETGTAWGQTAEAIGCALHVNGQGRLVTFETDPDRAVAASERCAGLPVDVRQVPSLEGIAALDGRPGFVWLDSTFELRADELAAIDPKLAPGAVVGVHDVGPKFARFRDQLLAVARRHNMQVMQLPTPRGVVFLQ